MIPAATASSTLTAVSEDVVMRGLPDLKGLVKVVPFDGVDVSTWKSFKDDFINMVSLLSDGCDMLLESIPKFDDSELEDLEFQQPVKSKLIFAIVRLSLIHI